MAAKAPPVSHSLLRKQMLSKGRLSDNAGRLTSSINADFDLQKTIFKTLPPRSLGRLFQNTKLDEVITWDPALLAEVEAAFSKLPAQVSNDEPIFKFMFEECDFSCEHADGSFLDHLYFCRDYSALHFPKASSRVMFLHSICGVGTNCFPMESAKLPTLACVGPCLARQPHHFVMRHSRGNFADAGGSSTLRSSRSSRPSPPSCGC